MTRRLAALFLAVFLPGCHTALDRHLATLDGRRVEVATAGDGGTPVVFEAGLGNDWTSWDEVAGRVAAHTRVFAYSRPGYGASDPVDTPRDPSHIADELRALLRAQGVPPPYVLVGHSFGGGYLELYAKRYPSEVAALVLVDPRHRDFSTRCAGAGLDGCGIPAAMVAMLPLVQREEYRGYGAAEEELAPLGGFGAFPVRVLVATVHPPANPPREVLWRSLLVSLAAEATDGQAVVFEGAGHVLQAERPAEVARAIVAVLPPR